MLLTSPVFRSHEDPSGPLPESEFKTGFVVRDPGMEKYVPLPLGQTGPERNKIVTPEEYGPLGSQDPFGLVDQCDSSSERPFTLVRFHRSFQFRLVHGRLRTPSLQCHQSPGSGSVLLVSYLAVTTKDVSFDRCESHPKRGSVPTSCPIPPRTPVTDLTRVVL